MRFSNLFSRTLRDDQNEADAVSHNLLLRAGYVRQLAAGIFSYLHFGQRSMRKIEQILREEMDAIGGDEICMPIVHPAEVWQKTGRWYEIDDSMARFKDRGDREMVLAMTHEEVVADLASKEIDSYKQLPKLVYQIFTKFRDEARSRGGLIRVREFTMKDSYSLDTSWEGLEKQYKAHYDSYFRIFTRAGLPSVAILSDTGMMGGRIAHEYMYVTPIGEDTIFICEETGYKANKEVAKFRKVYSTQPQKGLEKVHTPGTKTIADLTNFLKIEESQTAKVVFYAGKKEEEVKVVIAVVPGHLEAHTIKIQKIVGLTDLRLATEDEIKSIGSVAGFASPIGIDRSKSIVIIDELIEKTNNLVCGANETDYHYINSCHVRDYKADFVADIVAAYDGAVAPNAEDDNHTMKAVRGIEIGNIFQLGSKYTAAMDATFMDVDGRPKPIIMGSYGIGVGRMLACLVEEHNDEKGLKLPISVAPYHVHIVGLMKGDDAIETANKLYTNLKAEGIEVIFDDRGNKVASPGVKFKDSELLGMPIRLTVSSKSLKNGGIEFQLRSDGEKVMMELDLVIPTVKKHIARMFSELREAANNAETWIG